MTLNLLYPINGSLSTLPVRIEHPDGPIVLACDCANQREHLYSEA